MEFTERVTHNLRLHLDNDEGIYRFFQREIPHIHAKTTDYGNGLVITTERKHMLVDWLKKYCDELVMPDPEALSLVQQDLIQCALAWVDWDDMADGYAEDFPELVDDDGEEDDE